MVAASFFLFGKSIIYSSFLSAANVFCGKCFLFACHLFFLCFNHLLNHITANGTVLSGS